jgi:hypothetical protein
MWKAAENTEDFMNRMTRLAVDLRLLGNNITDVEVVRKMLQVVLEHQSQVVISIETLLDINTISMEEVTGMLHTVEQRWKPVPILDNHGCLLLYEEEWMAKLKLCEDEGKGDGSSSNGGNGRKRDARGHHRGHGNGDDSKSSSREGKKVESAGGPASKKDQCKRCSKYDH